MAAVQHSHDCRSHVGLPVVYINIDGAGKTVSINRTITRTFHVLIVNSVSTVELLAGCFVVDEILRRHQTSADISALTGLANVAFIAFFY